MLHNHGGPRERWRRAALDPSRLVRVSTIAGGCYGAFGANWAAPYLSTRDAVGGLPGLHFSPGFQLMCSLLGAVATRFPRGYEKAIRKISGDADRAALSDGEVMTTLLMASRECFRQGALGLLADARLIYEAWPFDIIRVRRPVHFRQGTEDTFVTAVINEEIADRTPGSV